MASAGWVWGENGWERDPDYDAPVPALPPLSPDRWVDLPDRPHMVDNSHNSYGADILYESYAGVDIVAQIVLPNQEPIVIGELQTISYSTHRENTPVRFVGHVNPRGFVKGPRSIAGSLIFTVFNEYAFYRVARYYSELRKTAGTLHPLADMMPPFDVVLSFSNEMGSFSKMAIMGVTIVDEGQTMSVDDLIVEQTYSYMARGLQPMTKLLPEGLEPSQTPGGRPVATSYSMRMN